MTYAEKLRDPRWQKKRLEVFERDGWRCVHCRSAEKELQVHHRIYMSVEPWDYELEDLATTCRECHEMVELLLQVIRYNPQKAGLAILSLLNVFAKVPNFCVIYQQARQWADEFRHRMEGTLPEPELVEPISSTDPQTDEAVYPDGPVE